jgi:hypothetical protein
MTVIAWDGKTLCTDQQANDGSMKWEAEKAWYITNKATGKICIVTGVGTLGYIIQLRDWFANGMETALDITPNMAELIVVDDEGLCVFSGEKTYSPVRLKAPMAFGHGREYAMGAMAMGANASDAVIIANEYSLHCGKGVACYTIANITPRKKGDNQNG